MAVLEPSVGEHATNAGSADWSWDESTKPVNAAAAAREARAVDAVDRLLEAAETAEVPAAAAALLRRAARMAELPLRDRERAFRILGRAFRLDPSAAGVVADLERLAELLSRWDELLVTGEEVMRGVDEPQRRAPLWVQLARWARRLGRWSQALAAGENALALAPESEPALGEVEQIYRQIGHHGPLARLLERRVQLLCRRGPAADRHELCALQLELAALYEERLEDPEQAIAACERALAVDRANPAALTRLERLADQLGRRLLLIDVLDRRLAGIASIEEKSNVALRLAAAWESVGRNDRAARTLHAAIAAGGDDVVIRRVLTRLEHSSRTDLAARAAELYDAGHMVEALPLLEELSRKPDPSASDPARAALALRLGRARMAAGDRKAAREAFAAAVDLAPQSHAALETLVGLALDDGDIVAAVRWQEWLVRRLPLGERRTALTLELAQLCQHQLGDAGHAVRVLHEALAREPGARRLLEALLDVHTGTRQWRRALDVLATLAESTTGPRRAAYLVTAAELAERELDAPDEAVALFNRALDAEPTDFALFSRLDRLLARRQATAARVHNHRLMGARLESLARRDRRVRRAAGDILRGLGRLQRKEVADTGAAIDAYEEAAALDPDDLESRVALAELYELAGPSSAARALEQRCRLLERAPNRDELVLHVRAIHRLARAAQDAERTYRAAATLVALRAATPDEERDLREGGVQPRRGAAGIGEDSWSRLVHPDQDPRLAPAFVTIGRVLLAARARDLAGWGLGETSTRAGYIGHRLSSLVKELAPLAGAGTPELRFAPDRPSLIELVGVQGPEGLVGTLVASGEILRPRPRRELTTLVAKTLTYLREEQLVVWPAVTTSALELELAVLGLRHACGVAPRGPVRLKIDEVVVERYAAYFKQVVPADELDQAAAAVALAEPGAAARWLRGAIFTAGRVGLFVGGDIAAALQVVAPESFGALEVKPFEQVRDLVTFHLLPAPPPAADDESI